MFQFWSDWKRKGNNHKEEVHDRRMMRSCSMSSDNFSIDWHNDWNQKRTLSFKDDYVSFPSLDPPNNEVSTN
ncbi:uncharacterized protein B0P05DRAFT_549916 [Gilbertella persicaria]|uniref:uncharacterized protein n=1 Tax=Gilbertella persicaria TaxID=101096 RepID=UPI00221F6B98|nr:uncharacterized protein B0P05DRAFT_549916 [Gilbertella persicaria]KAI8071177.1 hypothetical protein B0P05DRAFT_549916 [Gilbertella persicaria]